MNTKTSGDYVTWMENLESRYRQASGIFRPS